MRISARFVSLALALMFVGASCSPKDSDQARKTVQEVEDKTKELAKNTGEKSREVLSDVADKGKQIVSSTGEAITDGWIITKVKAKFYDEKLLKDSDIAVDSNGRIVTLKGTVGSSDAKKRALAIANGTEGVLRVVDSVVVKGK